MDCVSQLVCEHLVIPETIALASQLWRGWMEILKMKCQRLTLTLTLEKIGS